MYFFPRCTMGKLLKEHMIVFCISFFILLSCQECKFVSYTIFFFSFQFASFCMYIITNIVIFKFIGMKNEISDIKIDAAPINCPPSKRACWENKEEGVWCCCGNEFYCKERKADCDSSCAKQTNFCCKT